MKTSEAQRAANSRYQAKCIRKLVHFHTVKDRDIIAYINNTPNFTALIKELLRQQMQIKK